LVFSLIKDHYIQSAKSLIQKGQFILASQLISRGLEYINKISFHFGSIQETTNSLSKYKFVKTLPWPTTNWETLTQELIGKK
jgi:hypothetical protein